EEDGAYQARLLSMEMPEGLLDRIRGAALARANLDASTGKVALVVNVANGGPAWTGLGKSVQGAMTSEEACRLGEIGYAVAKWPVLVQDPRTGAWRKVPSQWHLVRTDTGAVLSKSTVANRYEPFQNAE